MAILSALQIKPDDVAGLVRAVLPILLKFGFAPIIALYLVYALSDKYVDRLAAVEQSLAAHNAAMQTAEAARAERERQTLFLLRGICLGVNPHSPLCEAVR